jgi:exopolysaccharide biosynthesis WecB/TagA/CpsF family protein
VLPDGTLAVLAGRLLGAHIPGRVAGPDFVYAFLDAAASAGLSVFFLGATDATLAAIAANCTVRFPRLVIAGTLSPPFGELNEAVDLPLVERINAARPDVLFVGMTAPKQELWLSRYRRQLTVPFSMGVGAAFNYLAGNQKRVPAYVGRMGGEWLYRLVQEPRRLWRRNVDSVVFIWWCGKDSGSARARPGRGRECGAMTTAALERTLGVGVSRTRARAPNQRGSPLLEKPVESLSVPHDRYWRRRHGRPMNQRFGGGFSGSPPRRRQRYMRRQRGGPLRPTSPREHVPANRPKSAQLARVRRAASEGQW